MHYFPKCASQNSSPKRWYFVKCWKLYSMFLFWRVTLHITIFVSKRLDIKGTFWSNVFQTPLPTEFSARNKIFHQESARKAPHRVARGLALSGLSNASAIISSHSPYPILFSSITEVLFLSPWTGLKLLLLPSILLRLISKVASCRKPCASVALQACLFRYIHHIYSWVSLPC